MVHDEDDQADCREVGIPGHTLACPEALEQLSDAQFRDRVHTNNSDHIEITVVGAFGS